LYVQQTSRAVWFRGVKTLFKKLSRCSYQRTTVQVRASGQHSDSSKRKKPNANQRRARRRTGTTPPVARPLSPTIPPRLASAALCSPPATKEPHPFPGSALLPPIPASTLRSRKSLGARRRGAALDSGEGGRWSGRSDSERWLPRRGRRRRGTSGSCGGSSSCRPTADASTATGS
jgi:hypothetical protein